MTQEDETGDGVVSNRLANVIVAIFLVGIGGLVISDSLRLGIGWAEDGPRPGYFPFYTGLLIVLSSFATIALTLWGRTKSSGSFVNREQFSGVLKVFLPSVIYVALIGFIGIYVASALFIAIFMRWLGRFQWLTIAIVSVTVPFSLFLIFEFWFLVPLPKGPLEDLFGY